MANECLNLLKTANIICPNSQETDKLCDKLIDILEANDIPIQLNNKIDTPLATSCQFSFNGYDWKTNNIQKIKHNLKNIELMLGRNIEIDTTHCNQGIIFNIVNTQRPIIPLGNALWDAHRRNLLTKPTDICLGYNVDNEPVIVNVAEMPHLLLGGETRSGKTTLLNTIITSVLCNACINEVQFVFIDPKRTGFHVFEECTPFLQTDIAYDVYQSLQALRQLKREMYRRNSLFSSRKVYDIDQYNQLLKQEGLIMPYIFVVIDELAELIKASKNEVENLLKSLASLGRSAGIHLLCATQRPDATVLSTNIRSNLPYRIGLRTDSSRMLIHQPGCEKLIGYGDGYYYDFDNFSYKRFQTAYVSPEEIKSISNKIVEASLS